MKTRFLIIICFCLATIAKAQNSKKLPQLELAPFAEGFKLPVDLANCGDDRLFVVERQGRIWVINKNGKKLSDTPFLNIVNKVFTVAPQGYDERGLLGLAFHPNYPDSPYFYVNYIGLDSNTHISRFTVSRNNPNKALRSSELSLLAVNQPKNPDFVNHKAGCLKFGPDGYLYGTLGDGGSAGDPFNNAQDLSKLLGKMFRIDVNKPDTQRGNNYSIPADNPYAGKAKGRPEIWASGLRNPFRFSFDKLTGDLWLPDVGQDKWEEINMEKAGSKGGRNYGWSCYEGYHNFKFNDCDYNGKPYTFPIVEYAHTTNPCAAITGGFVYRGEQFPNMYGMYIYNDYCNGKYSVVYKQNQSWVNAFVLNEEDLEYVSFGEDNEGELYAIDEPGGEIEHIIDASQQGSKSAPVASFNLKLSPNPNKGQFTVEFTSPKTQVYNIIITDVAGNVVLTENKSAAAGRVVWNMYSPKFIQGMYTLHMQSDQENITQHFIVNR